METEVSPIKQQTRTACQWRMQRSYVAHLEALGKLVSLEQELICAVVDLAKEEKTLKAVFTQEKGPRWEPVTLAPREITDSQRALLKHLEARIAANTTGIDSLAQLYEELTGYRPKPPKPQLPMTHEEWVESQKRDFEADRAKHVLKEYREWQSSRRRK